VAVVEEEEGVVAEAEAEEGESCHGRLFAIESFLILF
jgi:hypothetical protein